MPRIATSFMDVPTGIFVTFTEEGSQMQVGRSRKFADESKLYDILRAAHAPLEARQAVEMALGSRRPGRVVLNLTPDQYHRLKLADIRRPFPKSVRVEYIFAMPNESNIAVDPPDEYLRALGRIVVSYSHLESLVNHTLILSMLGDYSDDGRAIAVVIHMAWGQRLDALSATLRIVDESLAKTYREKVLGLLSQAQTKRNAVIHQPIYAGEDGVNRFEIKARGRLEYFLHPVTLKSLAETSELCIRAHAALLDIAIVLVSQLPKSDHPPDSAMP